MRSVKILEGFTQKYKALQRQVTTLNKKANKLAEQQSEIDSKKQDALDRGEQAKRSIAAAESKLSDLQQEWAEASFNEDSDKLESIAAERKSLQKEMESNQADIRGAHESIEKLPDLSQEAAEIAAQLHLITAPDNAKFISELKKALLEEKSALRQTMSDTTMALPEYTDELFVNALEALDEDAADAYRTPPAAIQEIERRVQQQDEHDSKFRVIHGVR